jgi:hypothetical protein
VFPRCIRLMHKVGFCGSTWHTSLQKFGDWLRKPEVYAQFHKDFNHNDRIKLTPWKLEGRSYNRETVAYLPVRAPAWFRKSIGQQPRRLSTLPIPAMLLSFLQRVPSCPLNKSGRPQVNALSWRDT